MVVRGKFMGEKKQKSKQVRPEEPDQKASDKLGTERENYLVIVKHS